MSPVLAGLLAYVALQLAIGAWVSRRIASEEDYLLAGRSLGYGLATFSVFATWFGAESCVGAAGSVYTDGLSLGTVEPFAYGLCLVVMGLVFAAPLWQRKLVTLADLFRSRFSPGVERVAALLMIPTSVLWAAAQIRAFGQVLTAAAGIELGLAIGLAAAVVIAYTTLGGLLADAVTDVVQGLALALGLGAIAIGVFLQPGAVEALGTAVAEGRARLAPADGAGVLGTLEAWAVPIFGSVLAQELVARVVAARSPEVARRSALLGGTAYLAIGSLPVLLGLAGAALLPGLEDGEQILPRLAQELLPTWGYVLFAGALVSAILSTVDSTLLVASSLLSHNLVLPALPRLGARARLRLARAGVLGFGVVATALAWAGDSVSDLVHEASALGSAGIFVAAVCGLFVRAGGAASAHAALLFGATTYVAGLLAEWPFAYLTSLAAAAAAYAVAVPFARAAVQPSAAKAEG